MRIGLLGSGGREHAMAEALASNKQRDQLFVFGNSRNPGILRLSSGYQLGDIKNNQEILSYFKNSDVEFVAVGLELPLIQGVADVLREQGIPIVGPNKFQAQLEGSKAFMRDFMADVVGWGSPSWQVVSSTEEARDFISKNKQFVIKPIGLTGGKGVQVMGVHMHTVDEAMLAIEQALAENSQVLLEERLIGEEFSRIVMASDGIIVPMPVAQDFKYAADGDTGGMTGGMGSYTMADGSMPFLNKHDLELADKMIAEVIAGIEIASGTPYRGFLYAQFMATQSGVSIIEFNVRLGDPEAINEMALFDCDAAQVFQQIATGCLDADQVRFKPQASVCKYLVPSEYPQKTCDDIHFEFDEEQVRTAGFASRYASVMKENSHWRTLGSRTLALLGLGDTPGDISQDLEDLLTVVEPVGLRHRRDVGSSQVLTQKVERMQALRGGD